MKPFRKARTQNGRDSCGRFVKGNTAAVTHGACSATVLAAAEAEIVDKCAALAAEQGEVSAIRRDLIRRYVEAETLAAGALRVVEQLGLHGRGSRVFATYQRLVDRQVRLARMLGLARATRAPRSGWLERSASASPGAISILSRPQTHGPCGPTRRVGCRVLKEI
ncbi:MAG: hypothetical protein ACRDFA_04190 [bacterium]